MKLSAEKPEKSWNLNLSHEKRQRYKSLILTASELTQIPAGSAQLGKED